MQAMIIMATDKQRKALRLILCVIFNCVRPSMIIGMLTTGKTSAEMIHVNKKQLTHDVGDDIQGGDQAGQCGIQLIRNVGETFH